MVNTETMEHLEHFPKSYKCLNHWFKTCVLLRYLLLCAMGENGYFNLEFYLRVSVPYLKKMLIFHEKTEWWYSRRS